VALPFVRVSNVRFAPLARDVLKSCARSVCMAGPGTCAEAGLTAPLCSAGELLGGGRADDAGGGGVLNLGLNVRENCPQPPGGVVWGFRLGGTGVLKSAISCPRAV
jgi:hypothetical protein